MAQIVWYAHQYLSGSISRESPYEIQFCLEAALLEWAKKPCIITTALLDRPYDFHFYPADPWEQIRSIFPTFDVGGFDPVLILIGLPRLYKHKPVFCIPLYHELGHFVDKHWGVTNFVSLLVRTNPSLAPLALPGRHWAEHFADLFSACYVGLASVGALQMIGPGNPPSSTHPGTDDRVALVKTFIAGGRDPRIDAINTALQTLGAPRLGLRFATPQIDESFDDLRPARLQSVSELHGLFASSWSYFERVLALNVAPWSGKALNTAELERIVNDLTEKTIRNFSIREMWLHANSNTN
jgi:hypothetical protein